MVSSEKETPQSNILKRELALAGTDTFSVATLLYFILPYSVTKLNLVFLQVPQCKSWGPLCHGPMAQWHIGQSASGRPKIFKNAASFFSLLDALGSIHSCTSLISRRFPVCRQKCSANQHRRVL